MAWGGLTEGQGGVRPAPAARGRRTKGGALPRVGESTYDGRAGDQTGNAMTHDGAITFADCTIMKPICLPSCPGSPSVVAAARVRPAGLLVKPQSIRKITTAQRLISDAQKGNSVIGFIQSSLATQP